MCQFFSAIVTKDSILFDKNIDQHEDLIKNAGLDDTSMNPDFVRVEITPTIDVFNHDPNNWKFKTDQDLIPDWFNKEVAEERTRNALEEVLKEIIFIDCKNVKVKGNDRAFVKNSSINAFGNSSIVAYGHSSVVAYNYSHVLAYDHSSVVACGKSSIEAHDHSSIRAHDHSSVEAHDHSSVVAYGNSSVVACGKSSIEAHDHSSIRAYGNSSIEVHDHSSVAAHDHSSVEAHDHSSVVAYNYSHVLAYGNSSIIAHDHSSVNAYDDTYTQIYHKLVKTTITGNAIIRDGTKIYVSKSSKMTLERNKRCKL